MCILEDLHLLVVLLRMLCTCFTFHQAKITRPYTAGVSMFVYFLLGLPCLPFPSFAFGRRSFRIFVLFCYISVIRFSHAFLLHVVVKIRQNPWSLQLAEDVLRRQDRLEEAEAMLKNLVDQAHVSFGILTFKWLNGMGSGQVKHYCLGDSQD